MLIKMKTVAIIVAHPDDETLWAGGTILTQPSWNFFIACLCRKNDADRAPKFFKALQLFKADGQMGDMDDSPEKGFTEVGTGVIDYEKIFRQKDIAGMAYFFVEQDRCSLDPMESITISFENLKNIMH